MEWHRNTKRAFVSVFLHSHRDSILKSWTKIESVDEYFAVVDILVMSTTIQYWRKGFSANPRTRMKMIKKMSWIVTEIGGIGYPLTYQVEMKKLIHSHDEKNLIWRRRFRFHLNVFHFDSALSYVILVEEASIKRNFL